MKIALPLAALIAGAIIWNLYLSPSRTASLREAPDSLADRAQMGEEHQDHDPKHGGTFFMAMNNHHHLEGVLEAPGVFRVYVYDSFTEPLSLEQMKQVSGKVLVGEDEDAPQVPLTLSRDGATLEATLGSRTSLPVTLTLLMHFPGMPRDSRPELFTFPFREYTKPAAAQ